jgi:hypothetical protein
MNTIMNLFAKPWIVVSVVAILAGCDQGDHKVVPDVSGIKVAVKLQRFEQDIFALDTNKVDDGLPQLAQKYPGLLQLFTENIIHDQTNPTETPTAAVRGFVTAPEMRKLYDTVQQVYGDLRWLEKDLSQMFRYYKYYFPQKTVPQVATIISEYSVDAFTYGDSLCGIGLDLFLGAQYPGYNPEIFPAYIRRQFQRDYITIRLAKAVAQNTFGDLPPGNRLLDMMLYNGKMLYIVDCMLPAVPDSMKMGYTTEQIEGCEANEQAVWARLLTQNLLYSSDFEEFRKLVTPSPNAPVVYQEAPGEIGNWIGWQIVKAYMKRHPETTMEALQKMQDAQKFLEQAKYKPRRQQ